MNQDPHDADLRESGHARQDSTNCVRAGNQADTDPGAADDEHNCTSLEAEAAVTCLAAYGYEVPNNGLMHGVPARD